MESGIGYRFHPTHEEIVNHYLRLKMLGCDDEVGMIPEVNVLKVEPWDIPKEAVMMPNNSNDQEWYFFCAPNYKYSNSQRVDRKTKAGFWKVTGKDCKILEIGIKKTLVFYKGRGSNAVKTNWVIHEYSATFNFPTKRDFVICKLKKKLNGEDLPEERETSTMTVAAEYTENQNLYENNHVSTYGGGRFNHQVDYPTEDDSQIQAYIQSFHGYNNMDYNLSAALQWPNCNHYND